MSNKVVQGDNMFFKDDVQIIDSEIATPLNMPPNIPIFSRDELQIFYNGHIFVATKETTKDALIKVYTLTYGLKEIESPKEQEDKYFSDNSALTDKLKADFIERSVNGICLQNNEHLRGNLGTQISAELIERVTQEYSSLTNPITSAPLSVKGLIAKLNDGSLFNSYMKNFERALLLEKKLYSLATIPEYISKFQQSFNSDHYDNILNKCSSATPEEVYKILTDNSDKIHSKVLSLVRNKIWHSDRSFKLFLDGIYWIPEFKDKVDNSVSNYQRLLERKIKIDAAKKYI